MAINILTPDALPEQIAFWQRALRLEDWKITAEIVDDEEFEDDGLLGNSLHDLNIRKAHIKIVSPEMGDRILENYKLEPFYDMENVFVHEMIHVFLEPLDADDDQHFLEQRVNHLADLMMKCRWAIEGWLKYQDTLAAAAQEPAND
jgi:hypothetical protein